MSKTMGMTVTAISMITVPQTVGVKMRRRRARRAERANCTRAEAATSDASMPGPPSARAVTHTAMNAPEVPIIRMYPEPTYPMRRAWNAVVTPLMASAAKAAHVR